MGNSRPLLRWIVRTCTASASDSSRRVRSSSPPSSTAARIRARSQPARAVVPRRSSTATRCRSWPTWRRSVMRRSPSTCSKTRSVSRSDAVMTSSSEATPRVRSTRAQPCRRRWTDSQVSSSASATRWAVQPRNGVRAAAWARGPDVGRSSACRRSCHAFALSLAKTLPAPLMTAGTPTRRSASCTSVAWRVLAHEHGDVTRADGVRAGRLARRRALLDLRVRRHHPHDVGGDVVGHVLARALGRRLAALRDRHRGVGALDDPDAQRRVGRRAVQPAVAMRGDRLDRAVEDLVVAEAGAAEHGVQRGDEVLIAAPVRGQCLLVTRHARGRRGRRGRRRRGRRRSPAWDRRSARGRAASAASRFSANARRTMSHWIGSVSWNSSTRAIL